MNAKQLFTQEGKPLDLWLCQKCACYNTVHYSRENAEKCCKCYTCGTAEVKGIRECQKCTDARYERNEQERFEKATKIPVVEYDGRVLVDDSVLEIGDYLDEFEDGEIDMPDWVWATTSRPILDARYFDINELLFMATDDNSYDGFDPETNLHGIEELQAALTTFYDLNKEVLVYEEDHSRVVFLKG